MSEGLFKLINEIFCANGQIAVRLRDELRARKNLVLTIPGGPGLSGRYLDSFLESLALDASWNTAILDLPNHGRSRMNHGGATVEYKDATRLIAQAVNELNLSYSNIVLWGHSLGARLALDVVGSIGVEVQGAILTGMPYELVPSKEFMSKFEELRIDYDSATSEASRAENWRKVLPLYFRRSPSAAELDKLSFDTHFIKNEKFLNGIGDLKNTGETLYAMNKSIPLLFIQGEHDRVVPNDNQNRIRAVFKDAQFLSLPGAGHFESLEAPQLLSGAIQEFVSQCNRGTP